MALISLAPRPGCTTSWWSRGRRRPTCWPGPGTRRDTPLPGQGGASLLVGRSAARQQPRSAASPDYRRGDVIVVAHRSGELPLHGHRPASWATRPSQDPGGRGPADPGHVGRYRQPRSFRTDAPRLRRRPAGRQDGSRPAGPAEDGFARRDPGPQQPRGLAPGRPVAGRAAGRQYAACWWMWGRLGILRTWLIGAPVILAILSRFGQRSHAVAAQCLLSP